MIALEVIRHAPADLHLDPKNPRLADEAFSVDDQGPARRTRRGGQAPLRGLEPRWGSGPPYMQSRIVFPVIVLGEGATHRIHHRLRIH